MCSVMLNHSVSYLYLEVYLITNYSHKTQQCAMFYTMMPAAEDGKERKGK